ncbi:MAG: DUF421 domain-containing protein [Planctomycetia bacterium]|nr:DUF421 domain-containing protein [Planctomycetia bacterium]
MWSNMFQLGVPVLEKMFRPVLVYAFLMIGLRVAGKRELAQLNAMDLIVLLTLSNTVQNAIIGDDTSVSGGLLGTATLLAINYLVVRFVFSHEKIDRLVEGEPDMLIENGKIRADRLQKELLTRAELEIAAHKQGFGSLDEVERAVLETGGVISFVAKKPPLEAVRHSELTARLDQIARELAELRAARG